MLVEDGRAAARDWVARHAADESWFRGAFFSGSAVWRGGSEPLPPWSDVDVRLVVADAIPAPGKFRHRGALLDVSTVAEDALGDADAVAASWVTAPSFATDQVVADPTGRLRALHAAVAPIHADPAVVRRRCAAVVDTLSGRLAALDPQAPWHEQVLAWMFPSSLLTHVVLVADLRHPTVRLRYHAARDVLDAYGLPGVYRLLLELLGCADVDASAVARRLDALAALFDRTVPVARTRFSFSGDITAEARPIAVDGSRMLVADGDHREAVFWIVATAARCRQILAADAPEPLRSTAAAEFRDAVAELLGLHDTAGLLHRREQVLAALPDVQAAADAILARRGPSPRGMSPPKCQESHVPDVQ
ncbi:hypothetical protein [Pseudonocardia nigra]|uniref:hypothetical protein n=1 Tax=Pseudonocardia nigra TaxID=1921578 RepID=UPI001C5FBC30|nr:hypothetical protein [Pseudonocardia nigra]